MNVLDKIKIVQFGLQCRGEEYEMCRKCPYRDRDDCRGEVMWEANEIINALRAELKKRTSKAVEAKPGFITLTNGILYSSDGQPMMMTDNGKIAVRVDDILSIKDLGVVRGSEVRLKDKWQTAIYVFETLEEILGKIADMKGE